MFKPLLGYTVEDFEKIQFPVLASPKLDGIRALNIGSLGLVSRNLKPIKNQHTQGLFGGPAFEDLDGELIVGAPNEPNVYQATNSGVMSSDGTPDVFYYVFDLIGTDDDYCTRLEKLRRNPVFNRRDTILVEQVYIFDLQSLYEYEEQCLDEGYEGIMIRNPNTKYKHGRSTAKVGELGKVKRFVDAEAVVLGFEELHSNQNTKTKDALGHSERSTHKEGMVPMNTLGALVAQDMISGARFNIGSGFTQAQRQEIWNNPDKYIGSIVKYKSFPIGVKDAPRFPIYLGQRDASDL